MWRQIVIRSTVLMMVVMTVCCSECDDVKGFGCMFLSNEKEFSNIQIHFDNDLPPWLTGTLVRNGAGLYEKERQSVSHVFDGLAKIASWKFFPNGTAFFSTRFVQSNFYKETKKRKSFAPYIFFSSPKPKFNLLQKTMCFINGIDNLNVNVYDFHSDQGGPTYGVLADYWALYQISPSDLSTVKYIKPKLGDMDFVYMDMMSSGHPLPEPGTTNRLTFLVRQRMSNAQKNRLTFVRMSSISKRSVIAEWKTKHDIPYMHSFSVTNTKAIMLAAPYTTDSKCLFKEGSPLPCMNWDENEESVLYIVELKTGKKFTLKMPALFVLHHVNAYDVNDDAFIMDVSSYDTPNIVNRALLMDVLHDPVKRAAQYQPARDKRIHVNLSQKTAVIEDMSTELSATDGVDMPTINEKYRSVHYCYVYGPVNFADGKTFESAAILKKDMCDSGRVVGKLSLPTYNYPSESVFVPNPLAVTEDDGVLLVPIFRGQDSVAYLAVVDARTMTIISKADTPEYVTFSFHGRFFRDVY